MKNSSDSFRKNIPDFFKKVPEVGRLISEHESSSAEALFHFPKDLQEVLNTTPKNIKKIIPAFDDGRDVRMYYDIGKKLVESWSEENFDGVVQMYAEEPFHLCFPALVKAHIKKFGEVFSEGDIEINR